MPQPDDERDEQHEHDERDAACIERPLPPCNERSSEIPVSTRTIRALLNRRRVIS